MHVWRACAALLALVASSVAGDQPATPSHALAEQQTPGYVTHVYMGSGEHVMYDLPLSYIPDHQCSGYLINELCPESTLAMSVEVRDTGRFPDVRVNTSLLAAAVYRSGRCDGAADVLASVACEHQPGEALRRRARHARRQPLQPAPPIH